MYGIAYVKVHSHEKGLLFRDNEFKGLLGTGRHWFLDPTNSVRVDLASQRAPWLMHPTLDLIVKSGALEDEALVLDLKDHERALVWIDGRFARVLGPGLHALWNRFREIRAEVVDARAVRFSHKEMNAILACATSVEQLENVTVEEGFAAVFTMDGEYVQTLGPGRYLFWKQVGKVRIQQVDLRETVLDIGGQEIMTRDKVTLRLNAQLTYRVIDPHRAVTAVENLSQTLYREAQMALRAIVGAYELDALLEGKERIGDEMQQILIKRATEFGVLVIGVGIRDLILPGEMKDLLNRVIEARKAAEANLIVRREETAAMRSQVNTAKLLENNPTLMRLRELEVLEKVAGTSELKVVLGEKGLADRVVNLL
jgi:regulator of protease activity HflC (stomatin/prohibitin superfamily)